MKRIVSALSIITLALIGLLPIATAAQAQSAPREVVSLDGTWEIVFDPENEGREGQWQEAGGFVFAR